MKSLGFNKLKPITVYRNSFHSYIYRIFLKNRWELKAMCISVMSLSSDVNRCSTANPKCSLHISHKENLVGILTFQLHSSALFVSNEVGLSGLHHFIEDPQKPLCSTVYTRTSRKRAKMWNIKIRWWNHWYKHFKLQ